MAENESVAEQRVLPSLPCQACGQIFQSRNLLFKHLRSGGICGEALGWEKGGKSEVEKVVLLLGYLASSFANPGAVYVAHHGSSFEETSTASLEVGHLRTLESTLWKALDTVRGVSAEGGSGREAYSPAGPPKLTRSARTDKGVSAVCMALSFNTEKLRSRPLHQNDIWDTASQSRRLWEVGVEELTQRVQSRALARALRRRAQRSAQGKWRGAGSAQGERAGGFPRQVVLRSSSVVAPVCARALHAAGNDKKSGRYEALLPVEALLPEGRRVGDRWRPMWMPRGGAEGGWRMVTSAELQGRCEVNEVGQGEDVEEAGAAFGGAGWEVRHGGAGRSMVVWEGEIGRELPASTLVEWTQQGGREGSALLRLALRVGGRWYATVETFGAGGCEAGADAWGREHRLVKLVAPFDRRKNPPIKQQSKAALGERKKGGRGGRGGRTLQEKAERRGGRRREDREEGVEKAEGWEDAREKAEGAAQREEGADALASQQGEGGQGEEQGARREEEEESEGDGEDEGGDEAGGGGGEECGAEEGGSVDDALRLCDFFLLEDGGEGEPPRVPEGAKAVGLAAGCKLEGLGFLVETEGEDLVVVRGLRVVGREERAAGSEEPEQDAKAEVATRDVTRVSLYRWIKGWVRKMGGRKRFHNFSVGIASSEARAVRSLRRLAVGGGLLIGGQEYVVLSFTGQGFLFRQLQSMVGLVVAVARGAVPDSYIDAALQPDAFLPVPAVPPGVLLLAECGFEIFEMRSHCAVRPRLGSPEHRDMLRYHQHVYGSIAQAAGGAEGELWRWVREELEGEAAERMRRALEARVVRLKQAVGGGKAGGEGGGGAVPEAFRRVLQLVREADVGGRWPRMSGARKELIEGQRGDSFTMGAMPPPLREPYANALFPELWAGLRELEAALLPGRAPSSTVVVNRNAQFKPHKDSGAGNGQSTSLIVGLGDYAGGELAVEGDEHCIRYAPLQFDGWQQRHWTLPFAGERFSIVWFTPLGCHPPPPPPPPLDAAAALRASMPALGWGSFQLKGRAATEGVAAALGAGFRLVDTACVYRNHRDIRLGIDEGGLPRERLFLTSKVAPTQLGFDGAIAACQEALEELRTGYLDLMLVHWPGAAGPGPGPDASGAEAARMRLETWRGLEEAQQRGWVRFIGVSNFTESHLETLAAQCRVLPMVNQCELHPRCPQEGLRAACARLGTLFQAYAPLGSPAGVQELSALPEVQQLAAAHGCAPAQILLAWAVRRAGHAVVKSTNPEHLKANLQLPELEEGECSQLDAVSADSEQEARYCWDPTAVL